MPGNKIELLSSTYHEAVGSTGKPKYYRTGVVRVETPSGTVRFFAAFNWGPNRVRHDSNWQYGQTQVEGPFSSESAAHAAANKKVSSKVSRGYVAAAGAALEPHPFGITRHPVLGGTTSGASQAEPMPDEPEDRGSHVLTKTGFTKPMDQLAKDFNLGVTAALRMDDVGDMLAQRRELIDVYEHFKTTAASIEAAMEMLDVALRARLSA